ncbi:MAG: hypothetical protein EBS05_27215 [Proteobacteria bacterium]|nr:hypothetical protein [Pseudomonadota bacterium]
MQPAAGDGRALPPQSSGELQRGRRFPLSQRERERVRESGHEVSLTDRLIQIPHILSVPMNQVDAGSGDPAYRGGVVGPVLPPGVMPNIIKIR